MSKLFLEGLQCTETSPDLFTDILNRVKQEDDVSENELMHTSDEEYEEENILVDIGDLLEGKDKDDILNWLEDKAEDKRGRNDCLNIQLCESDVNNANYRETVQTHTKHQCTECSKDCSSNSKLHRHLKGNCKRKPATVETAHECGICRRSFKTRCRLVGHMYMHTGEEPYACDECGQIFRKKEILKEHKFICHNPENRQHKCSVCDKKFKLRFPCKLCAKTFSARGSLKCHQEIHNPDSQQSLCTPCVHSCSLPGSLSAHMPTQHSVSSKPVKSKSNTNYFSCSICTKLFMTETNLKLHMEVHTGTQKFSCNTCEAMFSRKADLQHHIYIHTGEKPYKCSICPRTFRASGELGRHKAWHRGDHTCKYCGRRYVWKIELLRHVHMHEQEPNKHENNPQQCKYCFMILSTELKMHRHLETHARLEWNQKHGLECVVCEKKFNRNSNYLRHMREMHTANEDSEKLLDGATTMLYVQGGPFECDLCSKQCKSKRTLTEHVKYVHLKNFKHVCKICDRNFYKRIHLEKHNRRKHSSQFE